MLRIVISCLIGFVVAALAGRVLIPVLRRMKAGQSIKEIGPTWHMSRCLASSAISTTILR